MWRRNVRSPQLKCAICALALVCCVDGCLSPLLCLFPASPPVLNSDLASLNTNPLLRDVFIPAVSLSC